MFILSKLRQKSASKLFSNSITLSHDIRLATHDEWHVTCDTLRMTHYTLRVTHDTWQMGGGEPPDMCHLSPETWHETQDTYHMICDTYLWENNLSKFQLPNFYSLGVNTFSRYEGNGSVTELNNWLINDQDFFFNSPGYNRSLKKHNLYFIGAHRWQKQTFKGEVAGCTLVINRPGVAGAVL